MALVKAYELVFELSWKALKVYLESHGVGASTPKNVIREAFRHNLLSAPDGWMNAIDIRNKTVHIYDERVLKEVLAFIKEDFLSLVSDLHLTLEKKL